METLIVQLQLYEAVLQIYGHVKEVALLLKLEPV